MKKVYLFNPILWFSMACIALFLLYERYIGSFIIAFNIPFIPHMRTPQAAVLKFLPLIVVLIVITYVFYKIYSKKEKNDLD